MLDVIKLEWICSLCGRVGIRLYPNPGNSGIISVLISHRDKRTCCHILYPFEGNWPFGLDDVFSITVFTNLCYQVFLLNVVITKQSKNILDCYTANRKADPC